VDAKQLAAATNALLAFIHGENKASNNLLDDDSFISLVVSLQRTPEKARTKPFYAPLVHSLYKDRPVCLITCDGLYKSVKEHLKTHPVEGIEKVIGITKLRKEFSRYADKRKLSTSYDLFLADSRLMHLLPKLIGAKFFDKKKHPSLIDLDRADITPSLIKARDATYFHLRTGPTIMIKIARTSFSDKEVIENFNAAIEAIVKNIPKKWKGIQALYLRTATSVALPFYHSLPFTIKFQEADTPQLTLQSNSKRKAAPEEKGAPPAKKASLTSSLPSTTPFTTLTLTGFKPEAEETLWPDTPVNPKPKKKLLKRKVDLSSSLAAKVPQSQKKLAAGTDVASTTPAQQKAPLSQKKVVLAAPASEKAPATTQKKRPATPGPSKGLATPGPAKGPATPAPAKGPATPGPAKGLVTPGPAKAMAPSGKKRGAGITPKPKAQFQTPSSTLSPKASPQTPTSGLKKVRPAKSAQKKQ